MAKKEAIELINSLPDTVTLDEVLYHLYVRQQIESGLQDVDASNVYTHEEVREILEKKWTLGKVSY